MKGIYLLQLDGDTPADECLLEADPSISLNAITVLASTDTMQLVVRLVGHIVGPLINSGSTHSFISASVAARLHLDPLHQPGLHVKVANDDRVDGMSPCTVGLCGPLHGDYQDNILNDSILEDIILR
jgi:hypothetical protein